MEGDIHSCVSPFSFVKESSHEQYILLSGRIPVIIQISSLFIKFEGIKGKLHHVQSAFF